MKFYYQAFGLVFSVPFQCDELIELSERDTVDVAIEFGSVSLESDRHMQAFDNDNVVVTVKEVARYHIHCGKKIIIDACHKAELAEIKLFLFGSAFGALLHQRGYLVLHACTLVKGGAAHSFVGPSGIGKSTLARACFDKGYRVISDDVTAIQFVNGKAYVYPGYPQIKLWKPSADKLSVDISNLPQVRNKDQKFYTPIKSMWSVNPLPLASVSELIRGGDFSIEFVRGIKKIQLLERNTYRPKMVVALGNRASHFSMSAQLLKQVSVAKITRPEQVFLIDELVAFVEEYVLEPATMLPD